MDDIAQDTALIQALVQYAGTTPAAVAKRAGVAVTTVNRPYNGSATNRLGRAALEKLQAAYPDFPGWRGAVAVGDRRLPFQAQRPERKQADDLVAVREIDLTLGMGSTYLDVPITEEVHRFPRSWIRRYTRADPDKLFFAHGVGDSMEPTLFDSDLLLIDTSQNTLNMADKIWAIAYSDCGMVKRLRPVPGGGVAIMSDKSNVSDIIAHDGEMHIIGRVVAFQRKL